MAVAVFISAVSVQAAVETEKAFYGAAASPLEVGSAVNLSLDQFDPSLGALNAVTITLSSFDSVVSEVLNFNGASASYSGAQATLSVLATASVTASDTLTTTATGAAGSPSDSGISTSFGASVAARADLPQTSAGISPTDLSLYEGTGSLSVTVAIADLAGSITGNSTSPWLFFGGDGYSYGEVEIDYSYTASGSGPGGGMVTVPESGTSCAFLFVLGACVVRLGRSCAL